MYLEGRLDIRLPVEGDDLDDNLAVSVEPLDEARLGGALLSARRQGIDPDEWEAATRLDGSLPPAALGHSVMNSVRAEVSRIEAAVAKLGLSLTGTTEAPIELSIPFVAPDGTSGELTISGLLGGIITADPSAPVLSSIRFARPRPSFRLGLAVQLAALQYQQPRRCLDGGPHCPRQHAPRRSTPRRFASPSRAKEPSGAPTPRSSSTGLAN